jgi:quercetin dioxygenase-like cupin family protein
MRDPGRDPEQPVTGDPDSWLDEVLSEVLSDSSAPVSAEVGRVRLLEAARSPSLRYAPFYDRLGALWDLSDPALRAVFEAAADLSAWQRVWPGFRQLSVSGGPKLDGARARLMHFEPGFRFPNHRHRGAEALLVLEGSYSDQNQVTFVAGDLQEMAAGTAHELVVAPDRPCVAALVERGLEFTNPLLKLLGRWFSL